MFELIALLGGFWFIVFILFITALGIYATETDSFLLGTGSFIIALLGAEVLFNKPVWDTIYSNPFAIVVFLALFGLAGAVYTALWRWPEFLRSNAKYINSSYESYKSKSKGTFADYLKSNSYDYKASRHSHRLTTWIITWPFSLLWELLRKPMKYLGKTIYMILSNTFERVGVYTATRIHQQSNRHE